MPSEVLGVGAWVALTSVVTWFAAAWNYRTKTQKDHEEQGDRLEVHRDQLTFDLLKNARFEMSQAHVEVEDLRGEVRKLRSMEQHFYHFEQSLDHLEALLLAETPEATALATRNGRAFLNRMRRLQDAKGTIANEAQRHLAGVKFTDRAIDEVAKDLEND